jgi:putative DNA primase/helicase
VTTHTDAARFLTELFGPRTAAPVFVTSLPQARGDKSFPVRSVTTRDREVVEGFISKWDLPGRALYFCVSTLRPGAPRRARENVAELPGLHIDIDFKDTAATPAEIEAALARLPLRPQWTNSSGHGLHCYWFFPRALPATPENIERSRPH